eukprot:353982_1
MKLFVLLALLGIACANPMMQPGFGCDLIDGAEALLKPGAESSFEGFCVPQIQQQIDQCKPDEINQIASQLAGAMCGDFGNIISGMVNKILPNSGILGELKLPGQLPGPRRRILHAVRSGRQSASR